MFFLWDHVIGFTVVQIRMVFQINISIWVHLIGFTVIKIRMVFQVNIFLVGSCNWVYNGKNGIPN